MISFHPSSTQDNSTGSSRSPKAKSSRPPSATQIGFSGAWLTPHPPTLNSAWTRPRPHGPGLDNLGNTCFLNSIVQALVAIASVTSLFFQHEVDHPVSNSCPACAMHQLTGRLHLAVKSANARVNPRPLVSQLRKISPVLGFGRQEDAHEFLRGLLDALARCQVLGCTAMKTRVSLNRNDENDTTVHRLFGGMLESVVKCGQCGFSSSSLEPFLDLTLGAASTVGQALTKFCGVEVLDGDNQYQCDGCERLVRASKRLSIRRAPNVLCLVMKRFDGRRKNGRFIQYPSDLDLAPCMPGLPQGLKARYQLTSLVVHVGESRAHGHYRAYVKGSNGTWCLKDDATSRVVSEASAMKQQAYILFYTRVQGKGAAEVPEAKEDCVLPSAPSSTEPGKLDARAPADENMMRAESPASPKSSPRSESSSDSASPKSSPSTSPPKRRRRSGSDEERVTNGDAGENGTGGIKSNDTGRRLPMLIVGSALMQEVLKRRFSTGFVRRSRSEGWGGKKRQGQANGRGDTMEEQGWKGKKSQGQEEGQTNGHADPTEEKRWGGKKSQGQEEGHADSTEEEKWGGKQIRGQEEGQTSGQADPAAEQGRGGKKSQGHEERQTNGHADLTAKQGWGGKKSQGQEEGRTNGYGDPTKERRWGGKKSEGQEEGQTNGHDDLTEERGWGGKNSQGQEEGQANGRGDPREKRQSERFERPKWLGGSGRSPSRSESGGDGVRSRDGSLGNEGWRKERKRRDADASPPRRGLFRNVGQWGMGSGGGQGGRWEERPSGKSGSKRSRANDQWDEEYDRGKTRKVGKKSKKGTNIGFNPFEREGR